MPNAVLRINPSPLRFVAGYNFNQGMPNAVLRINFNLWLAKI
jgi:hypothetical protein